MGGVAPGPAAGPGLQHELLGGLALGGAGALRGGAPGAAVGGRGACHRKRRVKGKEWCSREGKKEERGKEEKKEKVGKMRIKDREKRVKDTGRKCSLEGKCLARSVDKVKKKRLQWYIFRVC